MSSRPISPAITPSSTPPVQIRSDHRVVGGAQIVPIETIDEIDQASFIEAHLHGEGKPLIIRNFARSWPAGTKWSFAYFREKYADDFVLIPSSFERDAICKLTRLGQFIDQIDSTILDIPGFWVDSDLKPLKDEPKVDPAMSWNVSWNSFSLHPELISDVSPSPHFLADMQSIIDISTIQVIEKISRTAIRAIYMGKKGTVTPLHTDYYDSHGCLTQISGIKNVFLFSPQDSPYLYDGKIDLKNPDYEKYPNLQSATAYMGSLNPGDFIFLPSKWWHYTEVLENSLTYSYNFFNMHNISNYLGNLLNDKTGLSIYLNSLER